MFSKSTTTVRGFTLIELVVTIGILAVIAVIVIPAVRTLNEDRKVRDTARVVGSVFAAARERAAVDGMAGVEIVSIPANPEEARNLWRFNLPNMGLGLYQLRAIPPFVGDTLAAEVIIAESSGIYTATAATAGSAGFDDPDNNVNVTDRIELNNSGVLYDISQVVSADEVTFLIGDSDPLPPLGVEINFKVYRAPVRVESSLVRLPNNLFLNMAWSGHGYAPNTIANDANQYRGIQFRDFDPNNEPAGFPDPGNYGRMPNEVPQGSTKILFNSDGSIDRVTTRAYVPNPMPPLGTMQYTFSYMEKPAGPVHLLMCTGAGDNTDLTKLQTNDFINRADNLWITIDHRNGSVSVDKMAQMDPVETATNTFRNQVQDARLLTRSRRSAQP
ncbi:MAG: pilus assembly FimT family protein [Pirellulaceae bacterium]